MFRPSCWQMLKPPLLGPHKFPLTKAQRPEDGSWLRSTSSETSCVVRLYAGTVEVLPIISSSSNEEPDLKSHLRNKHHWSYRCSWKQHAFQAILGSLALKSSGRNCSPAPDALLNFREFDSIRILILRGGILRSTGGMLLLLLLFVYIIIIIIIIIIIARKVWVNASW